MTRNPEHTDRDYMAGALALAGRGLGNVWPNPAVGCVLVRDGEIVGRGWTSSGGRPHAEAEALRRAGTRAQGATAYVTLEPCSHHGKSPPCADALIEAGIARVVIAVGDPDPRVSGAGIDALKNAGIDVTTGVCEAEALALNAGFMHRIEDGRPFVTVKFATSLDGRIATHAGHSQWITGEDARARGHMLRARHDAILIGAGTALADDPSLTCRLPGLARRSPVRVVLDGRLRTPLTSALVRTAEDVPTWIITLPDADHARRDAFANCGVRVFDVPADGAGNPDISECVRLLADQGITRLLVEGGAHISASALRAKLADQVVWFRAACVLGGDGVPAVAGMGIEALADAPNFRRETSRMIGDGDMMDIFSRVG